MDKIYGSAPNLVGLQGVGVVELITCDKLLAIV